MGLSRDYLHARDAEAAVNFDLNSVGEFDGVIGLDASPKYWGKAPYEEGYLTGVRKKFNKKYNVELPVEPF